MRTYLINIPTQLKQKMQSLDVQSILTTTSWEVFNDEGVKEVFIFKPEGELLISSSGDVVKASWEYIPANQSLLLTNGDQLTMFKPAFKDNIFLALQKDGTEEYLFMIDEKSKQFKERTLAALRNYFAELEKRRIEREIERKELEQRKELERKELEQCKELEQKKECHLVELKLEYSSKFPLFQRKEKIHIIDASILSIVSVAMAAVLDLPFLCLGIVIGAFIIARAYKSADDRERQWIEKEAQRRQAHNK